MKKKAFYLLLLLGSGILTGAGCGALGGSLGGSLPLGLAALLLLGGGTTT